MEGLLRSLLKAVENVEFSDDAKEENILRRLLELDEKDIQQKTLKDSSGVVNNFSKNKQLRNQQNQEKRFNDNRRDYKDDYNKNKQYNRRD